MSLNERAISASIDRMFNFKEVKSKKQKAGGFEFYTLESEAMYKPKPKNPIMWFQDGVGHDDDRLFSLNLDDLVNPPQVIIGDRIETAMVDGLNVKWCLISKVRGRSSMNVSCLGGGDIYQMTFREFWLNGKSELTIGFIAIKDGKLKQCYHKGRPINFTDEERHTFTLSCSISEDSKRTNSFMMKFKKGNDKFMISADKSEIKHLLSDREKPTTKSGRLKPILHLVSKHERFGKKIKEHKRGLADLLFCGYEMSISDHEKHTHELLEANNATN